MMIMKMPCVTMFTALSVAVIPIGPHVATWHEGPEPALSEAAVASRRVPMNSPTLLERVRAASSSGLYRPQNTATVTTGTIREDDKKRSAIAFALSGLLAFTGAGLWRWLPCRNAEPGVGQEVGGVLLQGYNKCYTSDGERKGWDTPTKALFAGGVGLEVVSLFYLIAHLRDDKPDTNSSP